MRAYLSFLWAECEPDSLGCLYWGEARNKFLTLDYGLYSMKQSSGMWSAFGSKEDCSENSTDLSTHLWLIPYVSTSLAKLVAHHAYKTSWSLYWVCMKMFFYIYSYSDYKWTRLWCHQSISQTVSYFHFTFTELNNTTLIRKTIGNSTPYHLKYSLYKVDIGHVTVYKVFYFSV